jgi:HK97 family phage prohead protease
MAATDRKTFSVPVTATKTEGKFKALISTFGVPDKGGDVMHKGAFAASLAKWRSGKRKIPVIWDHDDSDPLSLIGAVSAHDSQETEVGLVVTGELYLDEARGAKVYAELKRGTLAEWSFGAIIQSSRPRKDGGRDLLQLDLVEVSPVLCGKGASETLMIASAPSSARSPSSLTVEEQLAPYRARLTVAEQRVARRRQ